MGAILDFIGGVGNVLDTPGSMVRDTLGGQNPFDQLAAPWSAKKRLSGRDLLRKYGLASEEDTGMNAAGGVAAEMALDPLSWLGVGALAKGLRGASKAASAGRAVSPIKQAMTRGARPAVAMSVASPVAGAYLLGDNEEGSRLKNVLGTGLMAAPLVLGMAGGAKKLTGWKRQVAEFNAAEDAKIMQRIQAAQTTEEAERLKGLLSTAGQANQIETPFTQAFATAAGKTARPWKTTSVYSASTPLIKPGMKVVDYGSGPYQHVRGSVEQAGGKYVPFDRFGNIGTIDDIADADIVMASNVLNVQSKAANPRAAYDAVLAELKSAMKPNGTLVVNMPTRAGSPMADWMTPAQLGDDLRQLFDDVQRKGDVFFARSPKQQARAVASSTVPLARHESDFLEQMGFWDATKKSAALKAVRDAGIDDVTSPEAEAILRQIAPKASELDLKPGMTHDDELTQRIAKSRRSSDATRKYLGGALGGAVLARALSQRNQEA